MTNLLLNERRPYWPFKQVHERFVIVPVDKASNNFAIICKTFYINVIMKELGINKKGVILEITYTNTSQFPKDNFSKSKSVLLEN